MFVPKYSTKYTRQFARETLTASTHPRNWDDATRQRYNDYRQGGTLARTRYHPSMCKKSGLECIQSLLRQVRSRTYSFQDHLGRLYHAEVSAMTPMVTPSLAPCPDCGLDPSTIHVKFRGLFCFFCRRGRRLWGVHDFYRAMRNVALVVLQDHHQTPDYIFIVAEREHFPAPFQQYVYTAMNSRITFQLTVHQFTNICLQKCAYCHRPPPNGCDRIDSMSAYTIDNCVPCCSLCNETKGAMHPVDFLAKAVAVYFFSTRIR